ncbi:MAG: transcription antitermination factor NusB [Acidobacteriota bacterium]
MGGTRRKARECALQILFAADLVTVPPKDLVRDYWGEFGFDELHQGANKTVEGFVDQLDKTTVAVAEIRNLCRKIQSVGAITSFHREGKEILALVEQIQSTYSAYIKKFVADELPRELDIRDSIERLQSEFKVALEPIREHISGPTSGGRTDAERLSEIISEAADSIKTLVDTCLPAVEKLIDELDPSRQFGSRLALGTLENLKEVDARITTRADNWRVERMAGVDRNILRLAVYEFLHEDTPHTVVINEALEIARRFSTFEATQFINGVLDAIKQDLEANAGSNDAAAPAAS